MVVRGAQPRHGRAGPRRGGGGVSPSGRITAHRGRRPGAGGDGRGRVPARCAARRRRAPTASWSRVRCRCATWTTCSPRSSWPSWAARASRPRSGRRPPGAARRARAERRARWAPLQRGCERALDQDPATLEAVVRRSGLALRGRVARARAAGRGGPGRRRRGLVVAPEPLTRASGSFRPGPGRGRALKDGVGPVDTNRRELAAHSTGGGRMSLGNRPGPRRAIAPLDRLPSSRRHRAGAVAARPV